MITISYATFTRLVKLNIFLLFLFIFNIFALDLKIRFNYIYLAE